MISKMSPSPLSGTRTHEVLHDPGAFEDELVLVVLGEVLSVDGFRSEQRRIAFAQLLR